MPDEYEDIYDTNGTVAKLNIEVERLQKAEIDKIADNLREMRLIEENAKLKVEIEESNSLLRSAYQIAARDGSKTNWEAFRNQVYKALIRQHEMMYPKDKNETSNL